MSPRYTQANSLTNVEVGRKIRASRARLTESEELGDSLRAWKIWAACSELTASWTKGSDRIHVATIANMCNLRADKVSPILRRFDELGIFGWVKDSGTRKPGLLSLPSLAEKDAKPAQPAKAKLTCPACGSTNVFPWGEAMPDTAFCQDCGENLPLQAYAYQE